MKIYTLTSQGWTGSYHNHWQEELSDIEKLKPDLIVVSANCESGIHEIFGEFFGGLNTDANVYISSTHDPRIKNVIHQQSYTNPFWIKYLHESQPSNSVPEHIHTCEFNTLFTCYNNTPSLHRKKIVDQLAKYNLIENNIVTFTRPEIHKWQYHDGSRLYDEVDFELNSSEKFYPWNLAERHHIGFIDVVTESFYVNYTHMTEKTMKPVMLHKPFVVVSTPGFNTHFLPEMYGFEIYDEIFDYSFDTLEDIDQRIDGVIQNLLRINLLTHSEREELYCAVSPKLVHNKNKLIELYNDKYKMVPECLHFAFDEYSKHEWYGRSEVIDYALQMGWFK